MDEMELEYQSLRAEIMENSRIVAGLNTASFGITGALLAFALNARQGFIFLTPFAVLIPTVLFVSSQLESTTLIGQYLRIFLEPGRGRQWQSRWYSLRQRKLLPRRRKIAHSLATLYGFQSALCAILACYFASPAERLVLSVLAAVLLAVMGALLALLTSSFSSKLRRDYARGWQRLRDLERQSGKTSSDLSEETSGETSMGSAA